MTRSDKMLWAVLLLMTVSSAVAQSPGMTPWSTATYDGLTVGTSSRSDVLKLLGKPKFVGREEDTWTPMMEYEVSEPVKGTLSVFFKKGILDGMSLRPEKSMTRDDITRIFGFHYIVVHYAAEDCIVNGGTSRIYQDPNGPYKYMEYRDRGIAAAFYYNDDEKVEEIVFTYKAFGPSHSICAARAKKK